MPKSSAKIDTQEAKQPRGARAQRERVWQPLALYPHQKEVVEAYKHEEIRRLFLAWHRRAGKDVFGLDFARERMLERVGVYYHMFPFHVQARRAIWNGIDARTGQRFIDRAFPKSMRASENGTEMSITLKNGSMWSMLGSDNYDRAAVGANPCGVLFSEWALCNPAAWDYIRPILVENKGWAAFITTFRGRNHAWRMYQSVKDLPDWFSSLRTIDDTVRNDGSRIITRADVEKEIREGMSAKLAQQEFYCDPDVANDGTIFSRQHVLLSDRTPVPFVSNSRVLRVAWGMHEEGITALAFQDRHIIGVHPFLETNLADCVQMVSRRHPSMPIIHHAVNPDTALFSSLDGYGVVAANVPSNPHQMYGATATMLNVCDMTATPRDQLIDFAMNYAPYRQHAAEEDEHLTHDSLAQALAVMQSAQILSPAVSKPLNYSKYDRGVI